MPEVHIILTRAIAYRDKHYQAGDALVVSEATAQWLIEVGAAKKATPTEKPTIRKSKADD